MLGCRNGCGRIAMVRGLCRSCYQVLAYKVRLGKTSWAELEQHGKVLPAKKHILPRSITHDWPANKEPEGSHEGTAES